MVFRHIRKMPRRVFITVAEVSGDQHAAHLAQGLLELDPHLIIEGHGGPEMKEAGVLIHHETTQRAAMLHQAVARVGEMWNLLKWTKHYYDEQKPDLQICVDSPAMNFHFARAAHERGIPVLYYIAPQLWAWREGRMKKLKRWVDHVACILPFEEEYFRRHGVNATFVGHPLFDALSASSAPAPGPRFPERPPVIGLLPGSRRSEAVANFPHLLEVAGQIRQAFPKSTFLTPTTPATTPVVQRLGEEFNAKSAIELAELPTATIRAEYDAQGGYLRWAEGKFDELVPQCDLCLTVSGTATLHVAVHGVPMIVVYRGNPVLWHLIARWLIKTRTFSLVNLLSQGGEHIVPEFVPWYGSTRPVSELAIGLLKNPERLAEQRTSLRELVRKLDQPGASMHAARLAVELMDRKSAPADLQV